jgi:DNA-directed RNA polymerase specialized sigma24 family protein
MSSSPETSTHTTGAHRAHGDARKRVAAPRGASTRTLPRRPPARYEPYLDGLFTYCLSVLCDHDAATAALGDVLALAERRGARAPASAGDRRAWLYALARWSCLRKLAEARRRRQAAHASGRRAPHKGHQDAADRRAAEALSAAVSEEAQAQRQRELALLAWPEAAGTTPEQREALELAVRHQLAAHEVAAVLGMELAAARELLASAACEVERTRAALAVVETGSCPSVARLTGDHEFVLSATLRRELVRHVDDCPRCRRTAERAVPGAWPGTSVTPAALPVLEAPRAALHVAMAHVPRARGSAPRFDRRGFPMDPKDRVARRDRLRARAVTTTVVATVIAAPVLALWAAYRGAPLTGEGTDGRSVTASEAQAPDGINGEEAGGYENAGNASAEPDARFTKGSRSPDVSVEVVSAPGSALGKGTGHLSVEAGNSGDTTLITLTASGSSPVHWSAHTGASWLYLSQSSGTLEPGESLTIKVYVDHLHEPAGPWSARVSMAPVGAVVTIEGYGNAGPSGPGPGPTPSDPTPSDPAPTPSDPTPSDPGPTPSDPTPSDPQPTPTDSAPSDPGSSTPPPGDSGDPSPTP